MSKLMIERYSAIVLMIISIIIYFTFPISIPGSKGLTQVGPDFFPRLIILFISVLSLTLFIKTFYQKSEEDQENKLSDINEESEEIVVDGKSNYLNSVYVFLILIIYVFVLLNFLNFALATIISMFVVMWILSVKKWYYYAGFIAFVFLIDYVFRNLLNVQLP